MTSQPPSYRGYRFPPESSVTPSGSTIISISASAIVEDLLAQRGIVVTYETIRQWCRTFGLDYARRLRQRQGRQGDTWHLDKLFVKIQGQQQYLWRAVDEDGDVLDILVQSRRNRRAATRFFRKLVKRRAQRPRRETRCRRQLDNAETSLRYSSTATAAAIIRVELRRSACSRTPRSGSLPRTFSRSPGAGAAEGLRLGAEYSILIAPSECPVRSRVTTLGCTAATTRGDHGQDRQSERVPYMLRLAPRCDDRVGAGLWQGSGRDCLCRARTSPQTPRRKAIPESG